MAADLVGLRKKINAKLAGRDLKDTLRKHSKDLLSDAINDWLVGLLKSSGFEQFIAEKVGEAARAVGFDLTLTNMQDKAATRADFDKAITAKINALAGTTFESIAVVNRDAIGLQVGNMIGARLGVGPMFPVAAFRTAMGGQLVQAFDGGGNALFGAGVVDSIEKSVVAGWRELGEKAVTVGNPMAIAGPPRDAAHAARRAAGRKRAARFRATHYLHWVPMGEGGESTGNGREGLTGKDSGNEKPVRRWLQGSEH